MTRKKQKDWPALMEDMYGLSIMINLRFLSMANDDRDKAAEQLDLHSNPKLVSACPCFLCNGRPRIGLRHDGTNMKTQPSDTKKKFLVVSEQIRRDSMTMPEVNWRES